MKKVLFLIALFAFTTQKEVTASNVIDFRLAYPFVSFAQPGYKVNKRNYLGVDLNYQFYLNGHFGLMFSPGAWFVPIKYGIATSTLYFLFLKSGVCYRFLPSNWFDPTIYSYGGVSLTRAAGLYGKSVNYPVGGKISLNLYRDTRSFQDNELAFALTAGATYVVKAPREMKNWIYDLGLALRGAF